MKRILNIVGLVAVLPWIPMSAQEPTPTPPPPVEFRVVCLSAAGQLSDVKLRAREDWIPLRIPSSYLPRPVEYRGPMPVTFWVERPAEEGEGTVHVQVARAAVPENAEELLFLFGPNTGGEERPRYRITVLDFSDDTFPEGSFFLINAADTPVVGKVGGEEIRLDPGQRRTVTPAAGEREGVVEVVLSFAGRPRSMLSTVWFTSDTNREMMVFSDREDEPDTLVIQPFRFL